MTEDQIEYILEIALRSGETIDDLKWNLPDVDWDAAIMRRNAREAAEAVERPRLKIDIEALKELEELQKLIYTKSIAEELNKPSVLYATVTANRRLGRP